MRLLRPALGLLLAASTLVSTVEADIYVTNRNGGSVLVFADSANGNVAPIRVISGGATQLIAGQINGLCLDTVNGELFVSQSNGRILVFDAMANGNVAPLRVITGAATGLGFTASLAVDTVNDELYAVNLASNGFTVFPRTANGNVPPLRTVVGPATGIVQPTGIFVDLSTDEVFLTNESSGAPRVGIFPRLGNGNIPPSRQIVGGATQLTVAVGLMRNPANSEIIVNDLNDRRIYTYPANANGNVAPIRSVSSSPSFSPGGITLTNADQMMVADVFGNRILGFDVNANGNTVPARNISGGNTQINRPIYIVSSDSPFPGAVYDAPTSASVTTRTWPTNPNSYTVSAPPVLGTTITFSVDLTTTGHTTAGVILYDASSLAVLPNGFALLVGGTSITSLGPLPGPVGSINLTIPNVVGLAGFELFTQAVHFGGLPDFALANAIDLVVGI
ncbi:MAG: hypothetical protein AAF196_01885 [Planctomycetota bacterium]